MKSSHVVISGRVQGVGFRDWLVGEARRLGLDGWVRNVGHDKVEALLAGDSAAVEECLRACRRGPPAAAAPGRRGRANRGTERGTPRLARICQTRLHTLIIVQP
jgi:acylphosphatase